jgi:hypothetical protein
VILPPLVFPDMGFKNAQLGPRKKGVGWKTKEKVKINISLKNVSQTMTICPTF